MKIRTLAVAVMAATALLLHDGVAYASPSDEAATNATPVVASATAVEEPAEKPTAAELAEDPLRRALYEKFSVAENVPDEIIAQGDDATRAYLENAFRTGPVQTFGVVGCAAAVVAAIVSLIGPISKIKAALKAAGGAWKLAKNLRKFYKEARNAGFSRSESITHARVNAVKKINQIDYKELVFSLTGAGAVIGECFE